MPAVGVGYAVISALVRGHCVVFVLVQFDGLSPHCDLPLFWHATAGTAEVVDHSVVSKQIAHVACRI